jgi:hypothetical protein
MARRGSVERERYWREVVQEQQATEGSISAFCRERKVSVGSFFNWRRKLASGQIEGVVGDTGTAGKFAALDLSSVPPSARTGCEIVLPDGCRIIVPAQCDANWLREILSVLEGRSC